MNPLTLWQALQRRSLVQGELPVDHSIPWPVRIMLGLGAWLASVLSLAFLGLFIQGLLEDSPGRLLLAALAAGGAWHLLGQHGQRPFLGQIGLVLACMMQALLVISAFDDLSEAGATAFAVALIAVLSALLPSRLWRVWCTWLLLFALGWWVRQLHIPFGLSLLVGACAATAAWIWLHPELLAGQFERYWPLALGLSLGTLGLTAWNPSLWWVELFVDSSGMGGALASAAVASALLGLVNAWIVLELGRVAGARRAALGAGLVLLVAAASFSTPAVSAALGLLLLGFGCSQPVLSVLGIVGLLLAVSAHYYGLSWTLNFKALSLISLGIALLGARVVLLRQPASEPSNHA